MSSEVHSTSAQEATMVTLYFTKQFTTGTLKGLRAIETMQFVNYAAADKWLVSARKGIRKPIGGSAYQVVDASYQNYKRD